MTDAELAQLIRQNPVNATLLDRLPGLGVAQGTLVAGALFQTVWNLRSGRPPQEGIRDYDVFYWDDDLSYEAEDRVIRRADSLFRDLTGRVEVRNQARVHLRFPEKTGLSRPPLRSVRDAIDQFLMIGIRVGVTPNGQVYAPDGLSDLLAGRLRPNPQNVTPDLYAAKLAGYRARWPWLTGN
ncbi:nucleotidyltransferase family protein [Deinococcus taklimakanensis]|uniref:Nucleotidyltransferase family protein n=1 Tax=Deinococcus taklimakanensis TaxID=536443 RepID=A0ABW5P1E7_9DEIO